MNFKLALYFFLVFKNHKFNNTSGNDERHLDFSENQMENEMIETQKMYELNYKKKLLDLLKSKHISIPDKLDRINENNNELQTNILNGGFLDDW